DPAREKLRAGGGAVRGDDDRLETRVLRDLTSAYGDPGLWCATPSASGTVDTDREFRANFDRLERAARAVVDLGLPTEALFSSRFVLRLVPLESHAGMDLVPRFDRVAELPCQIDHIQHCWPT